MVESLEQSVKKLRHNSDARFASAEHPQASADARRATEAVAEAGLLTTRSVTSTPSETTVPAI